MARADPVQVTNIARAFADARDLVWEDLDDETRDALIVLARAAWKLIPPGERRPHRV